MLGDGKGVLGDGEVVIGGEEGNQAQGDAACGLNEAEAIQPGPGARGRF